ncbi:MAG TPA: NAD(P)-dependent oxidoreductase [Chloroflexota bacterium]|nr:NAD(P)-dependent oxidoreductase [Chloroflexota bacterium]
MNITFVGLGTMGAPMVVNLLKAGHQVTVWNRTREKEEPLLAAGARRAAVLEAAVHEAESTHLCLKDPAAVEEVLFRNGVLHAMQPGRVLVDHGTTGLALTRRVAKVANERGVRFLDAPISGGVEGARAATLAIMAGGEHQVFEQVRPALDAMGKTVRYVGPSGSGQALKLANQLLVIIHQFAASEAFAFARKAGVDGQVFGEILMNAWGRSFMLDRSLPDFVAGTHESGRTSMNLFLKDAGLISEGTGEIGQALPLFTTAKRLLEDAIGRGFGGEDITASLELYA